MPMKFSVLFLLFSSNAIIVEMSAELNYNRVAISSVIVMLNNKVQLVAMSHAHTANSFVSVSPTTQLAIDLSLSLGEGA